MDHSYYRFTTKARLDKAINTLVGALEGIVIDAQINKSEAAFFGYWLSENREVANCHPYDELAPVIVKALEDGVLTVAERDELLYVCENVISTDYYDEVTAGIQKLQGLLAGIAADDIVRHEEVTGLAGWLEDHADLKSCWPYDEIDTLVVQILKDGKITNEERTALLDFCSQFASAVDGRPSRTSKRASTIKDVCAVDPQIIFRDHRFCFTGDSVRASRDQMEDLACLRGGRVLDNVSKVLDYLVVGSKGNPCWAYSCYGRKIERAIQLRQEGARLVIVHERDFFDAAVA